MENTNKNQNEKFVCYDDVCLLGVEEESTTDGSSAWLDIFCPEDSCEYTSPTQLP